MTFLERPIGVLPLAFAYKPSKVILCDCNDTLLLADLSLNRQVFEFLKAAKEQGYDVHLVSDTVNLVQLPIEDCLTNEGLPADFFGDVELKAIMAMLLSCWTTSLDKVAHIQAEHVLLLMIHALPE